MSTKPQPSAEPEPAPEHRLVDGVIEDGGSPRNQTPEAMRALAEAEERRRRADLERREMAREVGGQQGPDPTRYGDWEKGGIISDF